jgi:response regulator NasT
MAHGLLESWRDLLAEKGLKVLLADADPERARLAEAGLDTLGAAATVRPQPGEPLLEAVARERPDVVIVDMARPDRDALDGPTLVLIGRVLALAADAGVGATVAERDAA